MRDDGKLDCHGSHASSRGDVGERNEIMPEIIVYAVEGRTAEQKKSLMKDITDAVVKNFHVAAGSRDRADRRIRKRSRRRKAACPLPNGELANRRPLPTIAHCGADARTRREPIHATVAQATTRKKRRNGAIRKSRINGASLGSRPKWRRDGRLGVSLKISFFAAATAVLLLEACAPSGGVDGAASPQSPEQAFR